MSGCAGYAVARIVEGMSVPPHFGIVNPIETLTFSHQGKSGFVGRHIIENINESTGNRQMHPHAEYVGIYQARFNVTGQGRSTTILLQLLQELTYRHGSHAKLSRNRLRRVTNASYPR